MNNMCNQPLKINNKSFPNLFTPELIKALEDYKPNLVHTLDSCFSPLEPKERLMLADWMDKYYRKPMEEGVGSQWKTRNMQKGIMIALCHPEVQKIFFQKMSQFGGTTFATAAQNYFNVEWDYNTCYYLPIDSEAKEHSKSKWATMIRDVPILSDALVAPNIQSHHPKNQHDFKMFTTSSAYCRGATSASRFQRITLHFAVLDEIDRMERDIGRTGNGEGSPVKLVEGRFREQGYGKLFCLGTPTRLGDSPIHELCQSCDDKFEWHAPCPLCSKKQVIVWGAPDLEYGFKWDDSLGTVEDKVNSCHYICKHCEGSFKYKDFNYIKDDGYWVNPETGMWIDTEENTFKDKDGNLVSNVNKDLAFVPSPDCSGLVSNISWEDGLEEFLNAVIRAKTGNNSDLVAWTNTFAGQPFSEQSEKPAAPHELLDRREDYYGTIPNGVKLLTMGVDFQDKFCKYQIDGHGFNGEQWALICERLEGRTDDIEAQFWDELDYIARKTYHREDNKPLKIEAVIADAGFSRNNVLAWCGRDKDQRIAVKGSGKNLELPMFQPDWLKDFDPEFNCWYVTINPYKASKLLYRKLNTPFPEDGISFEDYYHHPISDHFNIDYFNELTADKEAYKKIGREKGLWYENKYGAPNEAHDISKYQFIALELLDITGRGVHISANYEEQEVYPTAPSAYGHEGDDLGYMKNLYSMTDQEFKKYEKEALPLLQQGIINNANKVAGGLDTIYNI